MKTDETDIDQSCANIEVETSQPFSHKKVVWLRFSSQNSAGLFKKIKSFDFQIVLKISIGYY